MDNWVEYNGDYTYAEASNHSDSLAHISISVKDMGPYGTSNYDASFSWDYN